MDKPLNILLVDNDPAQIKTLSLYLQSEGKEVTVTTDPYEAADLVQSQSFDLLIVDLMMPEMDGIELLRRCRIHQRKLPAVLITGHEDKLDSFDREGLDLFKAILPKPLDIDLLINEIERAIRYGGEDMSTKELQEKLAADMKSWMKIEKQSVGSTGNIISKTDNPVIHLVMEIIQRDSLMHYRIQDFIRDTIETRPAQLDVDELVQVWDGIEKHIEIEKKTIQNAKNALEAIEGKHMVVQEYLLNYLLMDEEKHDALLETLSKIKGGMYPYGGM
jgi:CheY-like chemotaxis protein